jgi:succinate dehydrogenase/fumarate reductase flavoprotein subunit
MKIKLSIAAVGALLFFGAVLAAPAADESPKTNARPPGVSPDERKARLEDLRERNPEAFRRLRAELERRREELKNLPPAEREAKIKEIRERFAERRKAMSIEERKAMRQEIKGRLEKQLTALREKKTNSTLTAQEARRLERLETIGQRFKQAESTPQEGVDGAKLPK